MSRLEKDYQRELSPELVQGLAHTFISRRDAYPKQRKGQRAYDTIRAPLTDELLMAHFLDPDTTIGAYALSPTSKAKWVVLDADNQAEWQALTRMAADLTSQGVPASLELSRAGGHLWFFTPVIEGAMARRFGKQLVVEAGLPEKEIEVFPKQGKLREGGVGSFVRLPFGVHQATGKRYHFITPDGEPLAPSIREQMALFVNPPLLPMDFILDAVRRFEQRIQQEQPPTTDQQKYSPKRYDTTTPLSQQVKEAITIEEYVERFGGVTLDRDLMGLCPFHDDHEKSFGIDTRNDPLGWYCFACDMGGSIIDFEMQVQRLRGGDGDFKSALHEVAKKVL